VVFDSVRMVTKKNLSYAGEIERKVG